jgi:signal transduction histidine kinase
LPRAEPATSVSPLWLTPLAALALAALPASTRAGRRWRCWLVGWCAAAVCGGFVAWQVSHAAYGVTATLALVAVATVVAVSHLVDTPRPVLEPLLDCLLVIAVAAVAALAGGLMWSFATTERVFGADAIGAFAAAVTVVMAAPAALALRRAFLARRYGEGVFSLVGLTSGAADAADPDDPRGLLDTASRLVASASAAAEARILLDEIEEQPGWTTYPLSVGGAGVGTLAIRPRDPEGLEANQERLVQQLVPAIALVAHAVTFAVEARHARSNLIRQREAERARILADLHDDLGPRLAGMGMRVEAIRATTPSPEMANLAQDLADCRIDLRRIVSGLTPPALRDADLDGALHQLVASFGGSSSRNIRIVPGTPTDISADVAVLMYRFVAEAVTNAVRHGNATHVDISVRRNGSRLVASVDDDGRGGPIVPGVGLASLAERAQEAGGTLDHGPRPGGGLTVSIEIPEATS